MYVHDLRIARIPGLSVPIDKFDTRTRPVDRSAMQLLKTSASVHSPHLTLISLRLLASMVYPFSARSISLSAFSPCAVISIKTHVQSCDHQKIIGSPGLCGLVLRLHTKVFPVYTPVLSQRRLATRRPFERLDYQLPTRTPLSATH